MINLHRGLAPISAAAWTQIEEEASRTIKRHLAARRLSCDVEGPKGTDFPAVGTGHQRRIQTPGATESKLRPLDIKALRRVARSVRAHARGDRRCGTCGRKRSQIGRP